MFTLTSQSSYNNKTMYFISKSIKNLYIKIEDQYLNLNTATFQYFCNFVSFDLLCCLSNKQSLSGNVNVLLSLMLLSMMAKNNTVQN